MDNIGDVYNNFEIISADRAPTKYVVKCLLCSETLPPLDSNAWWRKKSVRIRRCCQPNNVKGRASSLLWSQYKTNAKIRNLDFELSLEQFSFLVEQNCHYCGRKGNPRFDSTKKAFEVLCGVDRKDPTRGYSLENCVPCCTTCNRAKRDMNYEQFMSWVRDLTSNLL